MNEFQHSCHNSTPDLFNRSWSGWHHYQVIGAAQTIILPSLIGIICSTGLVGNILIVFTIRSYTTSIPKQRVMRLAKMVLALVSVFVVSAARFHMIRLMNLQVSQPMLSFYVSYYIAICLSYASSSINPILYILLSVNFQKCLRRRTNVEVRMAEQDVNIIERRVFSQEKCIIYV